MQEKTEEAQCPRWMLPRLKGKEVFFPCATTEAHLELFLSLIAQSAHLILRKSVLQHTPTVVWLAFFPTPMPRPGIELASVGSLHLFKAPYSGRFTHWATAPRLFGALNNSMMVRHKNFRDGRDKEWSSFPVPAKSKSKSTLMHN